MTDEASPASPSDEAVPISRKGAALTDPIRRWAGVIGGAAMAERERWVLWLPAALGLGIALYFTVRAEPPLWLGPAWLVLASACVLAAWRRSGARVAAIAALVAGLGFAVAHLHALAWHAPILTQRIGPVVLTGRVLEASDLPKGQRVVLDRLNFARATDQRVLPKRVRVTARSGDIVSPADHVRLRAVLMPPPSPALPGAFDFRRHAYFQGLGAVGYAVSKVTRLRAPEAAAADLSIRRFRLQVERLRHRINARVHSALPGSPGAIAATLMTGDRGAIPRADLAAIRDSGLAHLLAISGLHIGLVAALLFFAVRGLLALTPWLTLRYPIKKWAAAAALVGALGYLMITGVTIPTQRAFLMTGIALCAVMLDRSVISMGLAAWAAVLVLLTSPQSLLGPSFQMSFAAVVALIAVYEVWRTRLAARSRRATVARRLLLYLLGVAVTTLVAGLATTPFAIYHFNRVVAFGLAANLVAVPTVALWIMPWAIAAYALMPLGLDAWAMAPMGWGIELVLGVAHGVANWPGAVTLLPAMPAAGIILIAFGGLWLCLWRRPWRGAGVVAIGLGLTTIGVDRTPDVLVDGAGKLFAVRSADGRLMVSSTRVARFTSEQWLRHAGQAGSDAWPREGPSQDGRLLCDALGCIYRAADQVVALVRDPRALAEDCHRATVIVSLVPVRQACPPGRTIIDRFDLWRNGGHALWLEADRITIQSVAQQSGRRLWSKARSER